MHALLLALLLQGRVDSAVRMVMQTQHIAGLSVGIARDGHTLYVQGYGDRDVLRHAPAQAGTVYRIASLTKMFTARAVTTLAQHRKLSLDLPAARYLPGFPWGNRVTVAQLLAQRSGIPSYTDDPQLNPYAWHDPWQLVRVVSREPLLFPPGTQYAYSNTNYVLLGMIVQHVTHAVFEDYVNAHVARALDLPHTRYGDQPGEALGYAWDGQQYVRALPSHRAYAFSAAAMTSTVPDMLRYLDTTRAPYYGLAQSEQFGNSVWYASGNVDGYSAFALIVPQTLSEVVILCNADKIDLTPLALDILAALAPAPQDNAFGPARNEDPQITAQMRRKAAALLAPLQISLLEYLNTESNGGTTAVTYRVTLSDGTRLLLHAPVQANGTLGDLSITPL